MKVRVPKDKKAFAELVAKTQELKEQERKNKKKMKIASYCRVGHK